MTQHFSLEEFLYSKTAVEKNIKNYPNTIELVHLIELGASLERVRAFLGNFPLIITSGYRCDALNKAVGGAPNSAHLHGYAADFKVFGTEDLFTCFERLYDLDMHINECIYEDTVIHIDITPSSERNFMVMKMKDGRKVYEPYP